MEDSFMAINYSQFQATKKMFREAAFSNYTFPLTYDEWFALDDDLKGAALYINFYPQIILAWSKFDNSPCDTETVVSDFLITLVKNVDKIKESSKKYTSGYIYTLAKRSFICMVRQPKFTRVYTSEIGSEITTSDNDILNLFDLVPYEDEPYEAVQHSEALWAVIHGIGPKAEKVVNHLINDESLTKVRKTANHRELDPLADVSVKAEEYPAIISQIREAIAPLYYAYSL